MDLLKIQQQLDQITAPRKREAGERVPTAYDKVKWKPTEPETDIRILPNFHCESVPIPSLGFYYLNGRGFLAPCQFGNPDPVLDAYNNFMPKHRLQPDEYKAMISVRNKLEVSRRYFAYVLVRGKEHEGVKIWEFSKTIFEKIKGLLDRPDRYGNITDLKEGRDIIVTYKPKEKENEFPKIDVTPSGRETPASTDPSVFEKIKQLPKLDDFFTEATVEELQAALAQYFAAPKAQDAPVTSQPKTVETEKVAADTDDPFAKYSAPSATPPKAQTVIDNLDDEFSKLLDKFKK